MSTNLAAKAPPAPPIPEPTADLADARAPDTSARALFSNWPAPVASPSSRGRELGAVLVLSAFFHAGLAAAALGPKHEARSAKRFSRVEVELTRAAEPPKPLTKPVVPPPAPKVVKQESKPLAAPQPSVVEPPAPSPLEPSTDTGSSAPAEEGGELRAGNGGLGIAPPPVAPSPVKPAPVAEPLIQAREGANYLKNPRPAYPKRAKREGWEGTTLVRVQVQASGTAGSVKIQRSSGHDLLDETAIETVTSWTFVPATQGGKPVAGSVVVPIVFRLQ